MQFPPVDVVIPARNAAATLGAAIRSVLAQSAPDLRVIVVDDGSSDDTPRIAAALAARDGRVTLIRQPQGGIAAAMNAGIDAGTAPFVARLEADDLSHPDRHAHQLGHLLDHPDTVGLSGAQREIALDGSPTGHVNNPAKAPPPDPFWLPAREPALTQPFFMTSRAALRAVGGYRAFPVAEDTDLYWRLAALGRLDNLPDILGSYRFHAGSVSGASVRHGRRLAIWSQLAALSAQRRQAGQPDITLPRWRAGDAPPDDPVAAQLPVLVRRCGLSRAEGAWLATAVAAKLVELAGYRPFELDLSDCRFIARALTAAAPRFAPANASDLRRHRAATAARLLRGGRLSEALALGKSLWPEMLARAAANRLYWTKRQM
ncbi:MAG: hypothetical protein RIR62_1504 [Pseudomonadota bacterium]